MALPFLLSICGGVCGKTVDEQILHIKEFSHSMTILLDTQN